MFININKKEVEVKYSFNSFKYMGDFDITVLETIEATPFKIVPVIETLLLGGLNHSPKKMYTPNAVIDFLEEYIVEGSITELLEQLMEALQESNFFKSLQKNQEVVK